jgi:putative endonuclease
MQRYYCYMLQCADGSYYTGWTTDPLRRLKEHQAGKGARYTASRRPLRLVYLQPMPDRSAAMRGERKIKALSHQAKQELIARSPAPTTLPGESNDDR